MTTRRRTRHAQLALALAGVSIVVATLTACSTRSAGTTAAPVWTGSFSDAFDHTGDVRETSTPTKSPSPDWWLGSGAGLTVRDGVASTLVGDSAPGYYRTRYAERDPVDTDGGLHPQNLFRLVTRRWWEGSTLQQCSFRILAYHMSASPQRYDPNGLLLFSRYADENDLYYAGIRVDGHAVVKKKSSGTYYTLAEKPAFPGAYDRAAHPILLPRHEWVGLRAVTEDLEDGSVAISLYVDRKHDGHWELLLKAVDAGVGGTPFRAGRSGIRTDFMDVQFDDYLMETGKPPASGAG